MGVAKSSLFEKPSGSFGDLILYEVAGQVRFRRKPTKYKDQKSPKQVAQRTRMRGIADLYDQVDMQLTTYWSELGKGTTRNGYNLFMSANIKNLDGEGGIVDLNLFQVCRGELPLPEDIRADFSTEKMIRISWEKSGYSPENYNDCLQIAAYTPTRERGSKIRVLEQTLVERNMGYYEFQVPEGLDTPAMFFVFFKSRYANKISTSQYIGSIG